MGFANKTVIVTGQVEGLDTALPSPMQLKEQR